RALPAAGLDYRDLSWQHLFAADPRRGSVQTFLDVVLVCRVRWRRRRRLVKDLAGLLASLPVAVPRRLLLRFARAYFGAPLRRSWLDGIARKAAQIRAHAPRFG
ncbi:MAG: hypothetical protein ACK533_19120, partial [Planctomycetota bacterium]